MNHTITLLLPALEITFHIFIINSNCLDLSKYYYDNG